MKSFRVEVEAEGFADLNTKDTGGYGSSVVLLNSGTVALELGGADLDDTNGWRGFIVNAQVSGDIAPDEIVRVYNPDETTAGEVDVLVFE